MVFAMLYATKVDIVAAIIDTLNVDLNQQQPQRGDTLLQLLAARNDEAALTIFKFLLEKDFLTDIYDINYKTIPRNFIEQGKYEWLLALIVAFDAESHSIKKLFFDCFKNQEYLWKILVLSNQFGPSQKETIFTELNTILDKTMGHKKESDTIENLLQNLSSPKKLKLG